MSGAASYHPADADRLEQLTADLSQDEWDQTWDTYTARGFDAAALVANSFKSRFKARYKVTSDAPPEALAALDAAFERLGDWQKVTAALAQLGAPVVHQTKLTDSGRQSVMTAHAAKSYDAATDPFARMLEADQTKGETR